MLKIYIDESGAIQIPEDMRSWLGIQPGDSVEIFVESGSIVIHRGKSEQGKVDKD